MKEGVQSPKTFDVAIMEIQEYTQWRRLSKSGLWSGRSQECMNELRAKCRPCFRGEGMRLVKQAEMRTEETVTWSLSLATWKSLGPQHGQFHYSHWWKSQQEECQEKMEEQYRRVHSDLRHSWEMSDTKQTISCQRGWVRRKCLGWEVFRDVCVMTRVI